MNNFLTKALGSVTTMGSKLLFKAKKSSPELLLVGGVALIIVGTVTACTNTKKAQEAINKATEKADKLKDQHDEMLISDKEYAVEKRKTTMTMVGSLVKAYAIPVSCELAGFALIFASHGVMKKRNAALLAAYNAIDAAFTQYRERVRKELGPEKDHDFMFDDGEYPREADDGLNEDKINDINREGLELAHANSPFGPYGFEFSKFTSSHWAPHALSNLSTIRGGEEWANRQLKFKGHLFLNDVLEYIGLDAVPWGQLVGWIRGNNEADGKISILAVEDQERLQMDNDGWKKPIFLDFNCDGVIWDKI